MKTMGKELTGRQILMTGAFPCDSTQREMTWLSPEKRKTIFIKKTLIWMGMSQGTQSDFGAHLVRVSDSQYVNVVGWDHYGEPNGLHQFINDFGENWMVLKPGDGLKLLYFATSAEPEKDNGGIIIWAWWHTG